jgi:hypothetical protein
LGGWAPTPTPQSPIPKSPIPNPHDERKNIEFNINNKLKKNYLLNLKK